MGIATPTGKSDSAPPWMNAGNMDNKELVAGSTLFIPINTSGANFEVGDGHANQGNGEVDITALETQLTGTFQFILHKGSGLPGDRRPQPPPLAPRRNPHRLHLHGLPRRPQARRRNGRPQHDHLPRRRRIQTTRTSPAPTPTPSSPPPATSTSPSSSISLALASTFFAPRTSSSPADPPCGMAGVHACPSVRRSGQ